VAIAVVAALACAGAAAGGKPRQKHTAADMAKARSIVLRKADLGAGWKASPASTSGGTPRCKGFDPDQSDLVETGTADSPDLEKGVRYVSSSAGIFATAAQAQASWNRIVRPGLLECLGSIFAKGASRGGVVTKVVATGTLSFPRLAPRTAAFRIAFSATSQGSVLPGAIDLVLLGKGRVDTVMISVSFGTPPLADEKRLARLIAARLP
jgi:hypothetical protein